mgnify:CR=1 FL=1|tara:strand:- start:135 stop:347 length:213 start_codon:yes stop_codon:yes gene_type:complete
MATTAPEKLLATIKKVARYMSIEWDMSIQEVIGAVEQAKIEIWNEWDSNNLPKEFGLDDDDDDDDEIQLP